MGNNPDAGGEQSVTRRNAAELDPVFEEVKTAIEHLQAAPDSEQRQCAVCLSSRSAYTDFHSLSVLQNTIDDWAADRLRDLFKAALDTLVPGKYSDSVGARFEDFERFCILMDGRDPLDTDTTIEHGMTQ